MAFFGGAPFSFTARFVSGVLALLLQMSEFSFTADPLTSTGDFWGHRSAFSSVGLNGCSFPAGSGARGSGEQGREPFLTSLSGVLFSFRGSCNFFMSSRSAVTHSSRRLL
uniref:Putative secreted protein n=1 Tax=Ixodes ricinus TaxID=34613 RepID=A0A6B0UJ21_IXORI